MRDTARYKLTEWLTLSLRRSTCCSQQVDFLVQLPLPPKEGAADEQRRPRRAPAQREQRRAVVLTPAVFVELELKPLPGLLLLPGLRIDYFWQTEQTIAQPRAHRALGAGAGGSPLKGGVGLFVQEPDPDEGETDEVFGNPWLKAERAQHYSLGVEWKPRAYLTLDGTGFYKDLRQLVSSTDDVINEDGHAAAADLRQRRQGAGLRHGAGGPPRVRQQLHRLARLHAVAGRAHRLGQDRGPAVRLRPDPHPDHGRQLPAAAQLAGRRPLPPGQRQPDARR